MPKSALADRRVDRQLVSVKDVFAGPFKGAKSAVVQKLEPTIGNVMAMRQGFSEHWRPLSDDRDLLVLAFGTSADSVRRFHAGFIVEVEPSLQASKLVRIYVDRFIEVGFHDRRIVSDANFYGLNSRGGGGARLLVPRGRLSSNGAQAAPIVGIPPGFMEQRLAWVRKIIIAFVTPFSNVGMACAQFMPMNATGCLLPHTFSPGVSLHPAKRRILTMGFYFRRRWTACLIEGSSVLMMMVKCWQRLSSQLKLRSILAWVNCRSGYLRESST